jgi:hypothetical protein
MLIRPSTYPQLEQWQEIEDRAPSNCGGDGTVSTLRTGPASSKAVLESGFWETNDIHFETPPLIPHQHFSLQLYSVSLHCLYPKQMELLLRSC